MTMASTAASTAHDYIGYKVVAITTAYFFGLASVDMSNVSDRALFSLVGALGAFLGIFADRPATWHETGARVATGVFCCFLIGPWFAKRAFGEVSVDTIIPAFGMIGLFSWFFLGSIVRSARSGAIGTMFERWLAAKTNQPQTPTTPPQPPSPPPGA